MIAKKYWIPVALVVIFVVSLVINFIVPMEWFCNDGTYDCLHYHSCWCASTGVFGWLALAPSLSILGFVLWLVVFVALWLFGKFQKRKKKTKS